MGGERRTAAVEVEIVAARPDQASVLSGIAWAAKNHWGYPASWMECWRETLAVHAGQIQKHAYFVAVAAGEPVGFHGLIEGRPASRLEHLWVLPAHMGQQIGRRLFAHAAGRARSSGAAELNIESDPNAEGFYLRMGAARFGTAESVVEGVTRQLPLLRYPLL